MSLVPDLLVDASGDPRDGEGQEIAPGVILERRRVLQVSAASLGALLMGGSAAAQEAPQEAAPPNAFAPVSFDQAMKELQPLAEALVRSDRPNEDAYLMLVSSVLSRLKEAPPERAPRRRRPRSSKQGRARRRARKIAFSRCYREHPLDACLIRLKPGASLPWHDHRDYNGVIMGVEGELAIKNFEVEGDDPTPPKDAAFRIRQTQDTILTPGRISTLSRTRDNIHDIRSHEKGGLVLDVFTRFSKRSGSHYLTVEDKAPEGSSRTLSARWR